ncbi:WD repeat-containing protein 26 [Fasciola gigantica]|uniref:WD repeat-containing protein 26 n=1 Tax=Fasciola gigantica TaxID=46835 RepID=A0A504XPL0_FASGI|nr:WD repeat-containing protein 26 [Fasciola gigantica]
MLFEQSGDVLKTQLNGVVSDGRGNKSALVQEKSIRDIEMLRLIGQYLCDKGLNGAYAQLSKESGISLEHIDATELRYAVLEGRWNDVSYSSP